MLFMTIERFKDRDAKAVYRDFRDHGRMLPEGLTFVSSWVEANFDRCFQLMECDDVRLLQQWATRWYGLIDFDFVPVVPGRDAADAIEPRSGDRHSAQPIHEPIEGLVEIGLR